jgi:uncharacterized RDD family membrane protein YckC
MEEQKNIYAGFVLRFAAYIADTIVLGIGVFIIRLVFGVIEFRGAEGINDRGFGNLVSIAITWLYYALMESSPTQATLGKMFELTPIWETAKMPIFSVF